MNKPLYNEKFKNLVLYVLSNDSYEDEGIKKLNKILYFIDFYFYKDHEKLISGVDYAKAGKGPIIDNYKEIFKSLIDNKILIREDKLGKIFHRPVKEADIGCFTSQEIDHIHNILKRYGRLSSAELESISHEQQPWVLTESDGEIIDPDLALLMDTNDSESETEVISDKLKEELVALANKN